MASLYAAHHSAEGKRRGAELGALGPDVMARRPYPSRPVLQECRRPSRGSASHMRWRLPEAGGDPRRSMARRMTRSVGPTRSRTREQAARRGARLRRVRGAADAAPHPARRGARAGSRLILESRRLLPLPARGRQERARDARQRRLLERGHRPGPPPRGRGHHRRGGRVHAPRSRPSTAEHTPRTSTSPSSARSAFPSSSPCPSAARRVRSARVVVQRRDGPVRRTRDIELLAAARRPHRGGRCRHAELVDEAREKPRATRGRRDAQGHARRAPVSSGARSGRLLHSAGRPRRPSERSAPGPALATAPRTCACSEAAFDVAEKSIHGLASAPA